MKSLRELSQSQILLRLVALQLVVLAAFAPFANLNDFFWHERTGQDWLTLGLSPLIDHFSFSLPGHSIKHATWFFDALIYLISHFGGSFGLCIFRGLAWFTTDLLILSLFDRRKIRPVLQFAGLILLNCAFGLREELRPELLSFVFCACSLLLYDRARHEFNRELRWQFMFILFIWSNYHVSAVYGYVIAGALYVNWLLEIVGLSHREIVTNRRSAAQSQAQDQASYHERDPWLVQLSECLLFGAFTFAVGFLNVDFTHPLAVVFEFGHHWSKYIQEYIPFFDFQPGWLGKLILLMGSFVAIFLLVRRQFASALILLVLGFEVIMMNRILGFFTLIATPFVLEMLNAAWSTIELKSVKRARLAVKAVATVFVLVLCGLYFDFFWHQTDGLTLFEPDHFFDQYPHAISERIKNQKYHGNLLSSFTYGGFFLRELSPQIKVWIDGRTNVLYSFDFLARSEEARFSLEGFKLVFGDQPIDYIVDTLATDQNVDHAIESGQFTLDFTTDRFALLKRSGDSFALASLLYAHPECLNRDQLDELINERDLARQIMPVPTASLHAFLEIATEYLVSGRDFALLHQPAKAVAKDQHLAQLLATMAEREGEWQLALAYFEQIHAPSWSAKLQLARSLCRYHECVGAEDLIAELRLSKQNSYGRSEALALVEQLKAKAALRILSPAQIESLKRAVAEDFNLNRGRSSANPFCETRQ